MKSKLMLFLAGLVALSTASAATITCTPTNNNVVVNAAILSLPIGPFACPTTNATAGNTITAVAIEVFLSFQDSVNNGSHQLSATATESSAQIAGSVSTTVTTNSNPNVGFGATVAVGGTDIAGFGATANLATLAAFDVNVTNVLNLGGVLPDNASVTISYTTIETPIESGVPEPTSMILLGSGFLAVGLSARLRRKARA